MERLTYRDEYGYPHSKHGVTYCEILDRLEEYEDAEEQGLLLIPKCGENDKLYEINSLTGRITERIITSVRIIRAPKFMILYKSGTYSIIDDAIGKTVFLTEQEAQAALEKMGVK